MQPAHKKVLKSISLELRHLLEGAYDAAGHWHPGDLEQRLAAIGVRRDRESVRADEMPHLSPLDRKARQVVDAYLKLRAEAGVNRAEAVAEFVRETAYTWANRLLALRCMEARDLIDEVILQKTAYGGRSLEHHRLAQRQPEFCAGEDDGLLAVLDKVFAEQAGRLPMLFDPEAPGAALPCEMRTGRVRAAVTAGSDAPPFLERLWRSTSSPTAELQLATQSGFEDACVRAHTCPTSARRILANVRCDAIPDAVIQDAVTAIVEPVVLSSLGHRWPKQTEAGEPVPDWAAADGIIPLTEGMSESTLRDRLVERNSFRLPDAAGDATSATGTAQEAATAGNGFDAVTPTNGINSVLPSNGMNSVLREFAELMGKPLDQWLATEFFKHHTSQFKKRPIAWQIQSNKFTARTEPAFACLIYYHKLDGDLLEKIRTQYVGPLRQRWETELRGIESVAVAARSDRQTARRNELGDLIKELQDFDACVRRVQVAGFETAALRQFALQDALLCMKSRWLRRLSAKIQVGPLGGWKKEAEKSGIHEHFSTWIEEAMTQLNHHCTRVGPSEWKASDDPTSATLAALICEKPAILVTSALECANQCWWDQLDDVVVAPLRQEMNRKKEALKGVQAALKEQMDPALTPCPSPERRGELKDEERRLKHEIKRLKDEIAEIVTQAGGLKDRIAAWKCREADGWESWLAEQPMYDAISSTDGHRQPPTTVPEWISQEQSYIPDINDGVRVNIAPLQKAGVLAAEVLAKKDVDKAIADRAQWRADERRWCREGKLPQPGWWPV